jgi:hypothetical protein
MASDNEEYRRGLLEGRMSALEDRHNRTEGRVDNHEKRLSAQERITYALLGALALIQVWPTVQKLLQ